MSTATIKSKEAGWRGLDILQLVLSLLAVGAMGAVMWASLFYARDATNLAGDEQLAQRIFYIHMGCNIGALAGFLVSMVGSIAYLITRNLSWDRLSQAAIEVGVVCGLGTIITGMFWAKPTWNTYWTWDPRLTTSTITVLVYLIARGRGMAERAQKDAVAAQQATDAYIRQTAGTSASASDEIAKAKALLDAGTINQQEYDLLKAKALAHSA